MGRTVLALLLFATLLRVGFAWALGLGVDESYMVAAGRVIRWGYFDHPPASWWMQWAAAHLFGVELPLAVRTPFILCFAVSTWLMYRLGVAVAGERAGLWAAVAFNLSPVFGVTTGTWVLPDGPLDAALLGTALCLMHALAARGAVAWGWWVGAGICAGLALFSKYTAILTIGGAFLYLLTSGLHRRWLVHPAPYLAAAAAAAIFVPVITWNAAHGWASFVFQGDRAGNFAFRPAQFFVALGGEALFVLPWIWVGMIAACIPVVRQRTTNWRGWLLVCLAAPPIVLFALVAVWSEHRVLFHWAAPGYLMLFPLLGAWIAERESTRRMRGAIMGTAVLVIALVGLVSAQVRLNFLHPVITAFARHDPDLEAIDWTGLRGQLLAQGMLQPGAVVAATDWRDAGKIAYALGPDVAATCLCTDARELGFTYPASEYVGHDIVVLALDHPERVRRELSPLFDAIKTEPEMMISLDGTPVQPVTVFKGIRLRRAP